MPFLRLPVDLTQELLPRLRIPTATVFLIKLFDFVVNHSIDNLTDERANAINSSPRKVDSPPVIGIGCVGPFDVCPVYRNARPVFGNCQELRASGHQTHASRRPTVHLLQERFRWGDPPMAPSRDCRRFCSWPCAPPAVWELQDLVCCSLRSLSLRHSPSGQSPFPRISIHSSIHRSVVLCVFTRVWAAPRGCLSC